MRELKIAENDAGQRLDRYLEKVFPGASGGFLQKMIRQKKIKVNHKRATAEAMLDCGDAVQLYIYDEVLDPLMKKHVAPRSRLRLEYVFENEHFVVIDKPSGLLSHPARPEDYGQTVVDAFVADLIARKIYVPRNEKSFVPALVNRLDRYTAGLVIGAKTHEAAMVLTQMIREGNLQKDYMAYVEGRVDKARHIALPLLTENGRSRVDDTGKPASTYVTPVHWTPRVSQCDIRLETGRTHQIRAHLSAIGHPLIGDGMYGARQWRSAYPHPLLLAHHLTLNGGSALEIPESFNVYSTQIEAFQKMWDSLKAKGEQ